jgi:hypothetical protein
VAETKKFGNKMRTKRRRMAIFIILKFFAVGKLTAGIPGKFKKIFFEK